MLIFLVHINVRCPKQTVVKAHMHTRKNTYEDQEAKLSLIIQRDVHCKISLINTPLRSSPIIKIDLWCSIYLHFWPDCIHTINIVDYVITDQQCGITDQCVITDQQCGIQGVPSLTWTTILETPQIMPLYL